MKKLISMFLLFFIICISVCVVSVGATETDIWGVVIYGDGVGINYYNGNDEIVTVPSIIDDCPVVAIIGFGANEKVTTVNIPDSVEIIGFRAFADCTNLKTVNIGAGVEKIGGTLDCLPQDYVNPDPTETLAPGALAEDAELMAQNPWQPAFENCVNLEEFVVSPDNATFSSEDGVLFNKDKTMLLLCPQGKSGSYTVPDSVIAFDDRGRYEGYLWSPFYLCAKLEELILSDNIAGKVENSAGMTSLKYLYIGKGVAQYDEDTVIPNIFEDAPLERIDVSSEHETLTSEDGVLFNKNKSKLVIFPRAKGGDYIIPDTVKEISNYAFYNNTALNSVTLPNSLEIIGQRAFLCCPITSIEIPENIREIGIYAFSGTNLKSFDWPEQLTEIRAGMFSGCKYLENINIPSSVTAIYDYAFAHTPFESFDWPKQITKICSGMFSGCTNLKNINIPSSVNTIGREAFENTGFESFDWPETVSEMEVYTFANCKNLKKVNFKGEINKIEAMAFEGSAIEEFLWPATAKTVSSQVFQDCKNLKAVTIPEGVTLIGAYVFKNTAIKEIICPKSVTTFGYGAFDNCSELRTIYYTGTEEEWESISKYDNAVPDNVTVVYNYIVYPKSTIQILDGDGNAVESLKSGDVIRGNAVCSTSIDENSGLYMALYDNDGVLKDVKFSSQPVATDEDVTFTTESMTIPENSEGYYVKIFLWTDGLEPLSNTVTIK